MSGSLFSGAPIPPQPTATDTQSQYPEWLQDYVYSIGQSATNLASQPYSQFPGPTVATPSNATLAAQSLAGNNVGNWQPDISQAYTNTNNAAAPLDGAAINSYTSPYYQTVQGAGAGLTGALSQASGNAGADYTDFLNRGALGNAGAYTGQLSGSAIGAGQDYTGALNQATQAAIPSYLSPYLGNVVGGIESSLNTNLFQNTLPAIQDKFVSAGQSRSPQEAQLTSEAIYANQNALGQAVAPALEQGYTTALGAAQNATNAGFGAGNQFSTSGLSAATGAANTGLNAGLGSANTGFGLGSTGYNLGTSTAENQQQMQQATGAQFGQLGALTQQLGGYDVGQLAASGQAQDTTRQANLNAAQNQFNAQQQWPYQNLAFASNIIRGQPVASNTYTVGLSPSSQNSYTPSPLSAFVGTTLGASAIGNGLNSATTGQALNSAQQLRKGGRVRPSNDNRRGALSTYRRAA